MLSIKEIVIVVYVTLVKPSIMQKLDGINIKIKLKAKTILTITWTIILNAPDIVNSRKQLEVSYIALSKVIPNKRRDSYLL